MDSTAGFFTLYFFYGLAFYTLGISAMLQNTGVEKQTSSIYSKNSYLGLFGLLHGTTEWLIMIRPMSFFSDQAFTIYLFQLILNSASFASLLYYGLNYEYLNLNRTVKRRLPIVLVIIWLIALAINFDGDNHIEVFEFFSALSRYFIGIPATFLTAYRFIHLSEKVRVEYNLNLADQFKRLSTAFIFYGLFSGLFITNKGFFPNNIFNSELLQRSIGLPTEFLRMIMAIIITMIYLKSVKIYRVEENKKMRHLLEMKLQYNERKKIAQKLHDEIIQDLFASGIMIESLLNYSDDYKDLNELKQVKEGLNNSIETIRSLMDNLLPKQFSLDVFQQDIEELAYKYNELSGVVIHTQFNISGSGNELLSNEAMTHLYYIIQEAVLNSIKHAEASTILVQLECP